jgi:iron complex transport system ATP-binding protein
MAVIDVKNLVVEVAGKRLLDIAQLTLAGPASIALIGPNGAGKSTLLSLLAGLRRPTSGRILLDDAPVDAMRPRERARRIGHMPQRFQPHWDISVNDLLTLGASRAIGLPGDAIARALAAHELDDMAERRWSSLSGGEQARALLAAVLVAEPEIVLADEPGAALDIGHRLALVERLATLGRTRLVVAALHDIELALAAFDRVIVLDGGIVRADGNADQVATGNVLDSVFRTPFEPCMAGSRRIMRPRFAFGAT